MATQAVSRPREPPHPHPPGLGKPLGSGLRVPNPSAPPPPPLWGVVRMDGPAASGTAKYKRCWNSRALSAQCSSP